MKFSHSFLINNLTKTSRRILPISLILLFIGAGTSSITQAETLVTDVDITVMESFDPDEIGTIYAYLANKTHVAIGGLGSAMYYYTLNGTYLGEVQTDHTTDVVSASQISDLGISIDKRGTIVIWDIMRLTPLRSTKLSSGWFDSGVAMDDSGSFAVVSIENAAYVLDTSNFDILFEYIPDNPNYDNVRVSDIDISPDGSKIIIAERLENGVKRDGRYIVMDWQTSDIIYNETLTIGDYGFIELVEFSNNDNAIYTFDDGIYSLNEEYESRFLKKTDHVQSAQRHPEYNVVLITTVVDNINYMIFNDLTNNLTVRGYSGYRATDSNAAVFINSTHSIIGSNKVEVISNQFEMTEVKTTTSDTSSTTNETSSTTTTDASDLSSKNDDSDLSSKTDEAPVSLLFISLTIVTLLFLKRKNQIVENRYMEE